MMNSVSLFSGYGGIDIALADYCRPILYCEKDKYAQGILLSRMEDKTLPFAPIWNDITTLDGKQFKGMVDLVSGGFPCQDISGVGKGAGLEGKRSGLFYDVVRFCRESSPKFIFLENVPAIRTRGSIEVQEALANLGYDSRWLTLSASEVGANHKRERWFCLAHAKGTGTGIDEPRLRRQPTREDLQARRDSLQKVSDSGHAEGEEWWESEPGMDRMVNGIKNRSHRVRALGNGVVPFQVKTAFKTLIGTYIKKAR